MFSWLKRKSAKKEVVTPADVVPVYHWTGEEIPRYPPFMKGLPVVPPSKLLETQKELIDRIADAAILSGDPFQRHFYAALERFASYAHLLPASQSHHHRGAGGLLRHSFEVALWALQSADKVLLDSAKTPFQRREMEPRWQLAVFLAALCHDAGKPVTDLTISDRERKHIWKPIKEDLFVWADKNNVDAYFIDWREGRSRQHTALSNLIADRIISAETLEWIEESNTELIIWLMESLNCNPSPTNLIYDIVIKADQASVERDLKSMGVVMAGYDIGIPIERHLTDIMRRFVKERVWRVNEPGARLWNIEGNIYLVWPASGEELTKQVSEDGVPGIPRSPDGILDMLVDRKLAFVREVGEEGGDRFWKIAPKVLTEKIPNLKLNVIRLRDDTLVSSVPIPAVEGIVSIERSQSATAITQIETIPTESGTANKNIEPVDSTPSLEPQSVPAENHGNKSTGDGQINTIEANAPVIQPNEGTPGTPESSTTDTSKGRSRSSGNRQKISTKQIESISFDHQIGESLKFIAGRLKDGRMKWGEDIILDSERHICFRWPNAFSGLGFTTKFILDELGSRDWIWVDQMAPLKKVLDVNFDSGAGKAIRLERIVSEALLMESGEPSAQQETAKVNNSDSSVALVGNDELPKPVSHIDQEKHQNGQRTESERPAINLTSAAADSSNTDSARPKKSRNRKRTKADKDSTSPAASNVEILDVSAAVAPKHNDSGQAPTPAQMHVAKPTIRVFIEMLKPIAKKSIEDDSWFEVGKNDAINALTKHGHRFTHGSLVELANQSKGLLDISGHQIKFRAADKAI